MKMKLNNEEIENYECFILFCLDHFPFDKMSEIFDWSIDGITRIDGDMRNNKGWDYEDDYRIIWNKVMGDFDEIGDKINAPTDGFYDGRKLQR